MTNEKLNTQAEKGRNTTGAPRDIHERAFEFGVRIIRFTDRLPQTIAGKALGQQMLRAGTSVGANLQEADAAESKRDFIHKTGVALKEAKETHYWLRLINSTLLPQEPEAQALQQEALELSRILGAIKTKASQSLTTKPKRP